ncbi:HAMP domain-containing protein [bacterium]|nr:HAMP domain-containing protein [bacterium]
MTSLDTLASRIFLILVGGIFLSLAITVGLGHREQLTWMRHTHLLHSADQMEQFWRIVEAVPPGERPRLLRGAPKLGLLLHPLPSRHPQPYPFGDIDDELYRLLVLRLGPERVLTVERGYARLLLSDGRVLGLQTLPPHPPPLPRLHFWIWEGLFLLCVLGLASLVSALSTRPLLRLAKAAQGLQRDLDQPPLPERGPRELRQAAAAFNAMQGQLIRHLRSRSQMLAAIAHDLQTPLTRLRLRLEKVEPQELRDKLLQDLGLMQQLVTEGLEFARSVDSQEQKVDVELFSLLDSLVQDARESGLVVSLEAPDPLPQLFVRVGPHDLRRCLGNLVDNAVKYGEQAWVGVELQKEEVLVSVRDQGPGLSPEMLEKVFEPFVRGEDSRSRETGGSGLGLAIARNLASRQGGQLSLENLPQGGLKACLRLPLGDLARSQD